MGSSGTSGQKHRAKWAVGAVYTVMKDKDAAEYVLRICTGIPDLTIVSSDIQKSLRNLFGKSAILDFIAQDSTGKIYNIEVQNTDDEEYFGPMRARYYQSIMDASLVPKGLTYNELPEMYIIFITPFNLLKSYGHHKVIYEKKCFSLEKSLKLAGIDEETYRQYSDKK